MDVGHQSRTEAALSDADALWNFAGRRDTYALQNRQGGYATIREPLTVQILERHLAGDLTVGCYVVNEDITCRFVVLDFDFPKQALPPASTIRERIEKAIAAVGCPAKSYFFEFSGSKGYHAWIMLDAPLPQIVAYRFGLLLKRLAGANESYPRQADIGQTEKGLGNLVKLPRALHRKSGRRSDLLDGEGKPDTRPLAEIVAGISPVPRETIEGIVERSAPDITTAEASSDRPLPRTGPAPRRLCMERVLAAGVNESERGGRETWTWKVGLYLKEQAFTLDEAQEEALRWNRRNRLPLYENKVCSIIEKAYRDSRHLERCGDLAYCVPHSCPLFLTEHPELVAGCSVVDLADRGWPKYFGRGWKSVAAVVVGIEVLERRKGKKPGDSFFAPLTELALPSGVSKQTASRILKKLAAVGLIAYVPGQWRTKRAAEIARVTPYPAAIV